MKPCRFNHNPTLLKTISGSSSHTINKPQYPSICSSCSPSFRPHLLVSSPSLSWLSRTCPSRVSYSLNEVTFSEASFPSFAEIFVCLEYPCQTSKQWHQLRVLSITTFSKKLFLMLPTCTTFSLTRALRACSVSYHLLILSIKHGNSYQVSDTYLVTVYWIHRMQILCPVHHLVKKNNVRVGCKSLFFTRSTLTRNYTQRKFNWVGKMGCVS